MFVVLLAESNWSFRFDKALSSLNAKEWDILISLPKCLVLNQL
jgi:hypothetical protein